MTVLCANDGKFCSLQWPITWKWLWRTAYGGLLILLGAHNPNPYQALEEPQQNIGCDVSVSVLRESLTGRPLKRHKPGRNSLNSESPLISTFDYTHINVSHRKHI
jgi:hypothetical protein